MSTTIPSTPDFIPPNSEGNDRFVIDVDLANLSDKEKIQLMTLWRKATITVRPIGKTEAKPVGTSCHYAKSMQLWGQV